MSIQDELITARVDVALSKEYLTQSQQNVTDTAHEHTSIKLKHSIICSKLKKLELHARIEAS